MNSHAKSALELAHVFPHLPFIDWAAEITRLESALAEMTERALKAESALRDAYARQREFELKWTPKQETTTTALPLVFETSATPLTEEQ